MGNTKYRGRILWFLITCRPDLLPIDLKRQGRAEVHIPLFPPGTSQEAGDMIRALAGKNDVPLEEGVPDEQLAAQGVDLSGADLEGVLLRAWRRALEAGSETVGEEHLEEVLSGFLPSTDSMERELQTLAAINECTDLVYLPERIRKQLEDPEERVRIRQRLDVLKAALG
jgi:SpoVK/Ycf46/Vps4 family AAA+-type ATPase